MISEETPEGTEDPEIQRGQGGWNRASDGEIIEMGSVMPGRECSIYCVPPGRPGKDR